MSKLNKIKHFFNERKRYAPLVNIGFGVLALGEAVINPAGASDSVEAASDNFFCGIVPYIGKKGGINGIGAVLNLLTGISDYQIIMRRGKLSSSLSYNMIPAVKMIQIGSNAFEAAVNEYELRHEHK